MDTPNDSPNDSPGDAPKPRNKVRIALGLGVLVMLIIIVALIPRLFDIGAIDDSDLLPPLSPQVNSAENVVTEIERVHALLVEPEDYFDFELGSSDPEESDAERLHELVAANEPYYAELLPLLNLPHFVVSDPKTFQDMRNHVPAIRSASRWIGYRHASLVLRDQPEEAAELALAWARAVRRHLLHMPSLMELLVAVALYDASLSQLTASAEQAGVSEETLAKLAEEVAQPVDLFAATDLAIRHEYRLARDTIKGLSGRYGSVARPFVFKPNRTLRDLASMTRTCLEAIQARDISTLEAFEHQVGQTNQIDLILSGNSVGRALIAMLTPAYSHSVKKMLRLERARTVHQTAIALRRYEVTQGQLPATLEELVPTFLAPGAIDPNEPLLYDPQLRWIGVEKPGDLQATEAPGIGVTTWVP